MNNGWSWSLEQVGIASHKTAMQIADKSCQHSRVVKTSRLVDIISKVWNPVWHFKYIRFVIYANIQHFTSGLFSHVVSRTARSHNYRYSISHISMPIRLKFRLQGTTFSIYMICTYHNFIMYDIIQQIWFVAHTRATTAVNSTSLNKLHNMQR